MIACMAEMASMAPTAGGKSTFLKLTFELRMKLFRPVPLGVRVCTSINTEAFCLMFSAGAAAWAGSPVFQLAASY